MNQNIKVGVFNWSEFPGSGEFYPDDLPEEWKLSYFSNEFDSVCIDLASRHLRVEQIIEWTEDLPETFDLSFSLSQGHQLELLVKLIERQKVTIKSLVLERFNSDILLQIKSLKTVLCAAGLEDDQQIIEFSSLWGPESQGNNNTSYALIPLAENIKQLRSWIENWTELNKSSENLTLWLQGPSTSYQALTECRTLIELMGK